MNAAVSNIKRDFKLADKAFDRDTGNNVQLEGLLGVDAIQFLRQFSLSKCINGSGFLFDDKIIPFGNINNFLSHTQVSDKYLETTLATSKDF